MTPDAVSTHSLPPCVPLATYVKVYLLENGVCVAKKKTKVVKKNLDPTYQQTLLFDESPQGKVLQVGAGNGRAHICTVTIKINK